LEVDRQLRELEKVSVSGHDDGNTTTDGNSKGSSSAGQQQQQHQSQQPYRVPNYYGTATVSAPGGYPYGPGNEINGHPPPPLPPPFHPYDPHYFPYPHPAMAVQQQEKAEYFVKLLQEREDDLKAVRKTLEETQAKLQEQSLLATRLQTTLDQVKASFEQERRLIRLEAEKEAQQHFQAQQQELFQKQLEVLDKWQQGGPSAGGPLPPPPNAQPPAPEITSPTPHLKTHNHSEDQPEPHNNLSNDVESQSSKTSGSSKATLVTRIVKSTSQDKHPWPKQEQQQKQQGEDTKQKSAPWAAKPSDVKHQQKQQQQSNNATNNTKMHDSMDNSLVNSADIDFQVDDDHDDDNSDDSDDDPIPTAPPPTPATASTPAVTAPKQTQVVASAAKPSDHFTPVVVSNTAPSSSHDNYQTNFNPADDATCGDTIASSTYGEDKIKVVNKELLDPYGDKGTYTGVMLRSTGMPHGLGRMIYEEDGRVYEGDW
jgi:hypothetical protein